MDESDYFKGIKINFVNASDVSDYENSDEEAQEELNEIKKTLIKEFFKGSLKLNKYNYLEIISLDRIEEYCNNYIYL